MKSDSFLSAPTNKQVSQPSSKGNGNYCKNIEETTHKDIETEPGINAYAKTRATGLEDQKICQLLGYLAIGLVPHKAVYKSPGE